MADEDGCCCNKLKKALKELEDLRQKLQKRGTVQDYEYLQASYYYLVKENEHLLMKMEKLEDDVMLLEMREYLTNLD